EDGARAGGRGGLRRREVRGSRGGAGADGVGRGDLERVGGAVGQAAHGRGRCRRRARHRRRALGGRPDEGRDGVAGDRAAPVGGGGPGDRRRAVPGRGGRGGRRGGRPDRGDRARGCREGTGADTVGRRHLEGVGGAVGEADHDGGGGR